MNNWKKMKAKVIETGETVEVNLYSSSYYKEKGQGYDRRGWYEDELEFEPGPKMISLDKVCEYLKTLKFQEYPGAHLERLLDDGDIDTLRKNFE